MASVGGLLADLQLLAKEAGRRHSDVRDAAEAAYQLVKANGERALEDARIVEDTDEEQPLFRPIVLASTSRNAKVIAVAVSALQRLVVARAFSKAWVPKVLDTLEVVVPHGVEIQLKVLQNLVSLLTTPGFSHHHHHHQHRPGAAADRLVQGSELGRALELSHRLSMSKTAVVASTASATLRQMFMFVFESVGDEDAAAAAPDDDDELKPLPVMDVDVPADEDDNDDSSSSEQRTRKVQLRPAARDAYHVLEDLCLLIARSSDAHNADAAEPALLKWPSLSRTFGLELVESIISGFGAVLRQHPELLLVLRAHLCPLLIRFLSSPHAPSATARDTATTTTTTTTTTSSSGSFSFPLTLRTTRVVFLLLKQFADLLPLESEVFLTMFVRVVTPADSRDAHGEGGHPAGAIGGNLSGSSPLWMRVLVLEIFRGLCADFTLMSAFYSRYDDNNNNKNNARPPPKPAAGGSTVFSDLMTAFNRLATEKPAALGQGAAVIYGSSLGPVVTPGAGAAPSATAASAAASSSSANLVGSSSQHQPGVIEGVMGMGANLAHVAGNVVGSTVVAGAAAVAGGGSGAHAPLLSVTGARMRLQCIDQLDKAEPPQIPETYIFLLALQCLASIADGFATATLSAHATFSAARKGSESASSSSPPPPMTTLDYDQLARDDADNDDDDENATTTSAHTLVLVRKMAETSWPALLASLSFFMATNLDDDLFADVLEALQNVASVAGVLALQTPRDAFLTSLCKFAVPPAVVAHMASVDSTSSRSNTTSGSLVADSLGLGGGGSGSGGSGVSAPGPVGLSSRNLACVRALVSVAQFLAGSLNAAWFAVFETLQNADFVIRMNAAKGMHRRAPGGSSISQAPPATPPRGASSAGGESMSPQATRNSLIASALPSESDENAIQASIAKLFDVSRSIDDDAFKYFVGALCRLNGEMIGLTMTELGQVVDDGHASPDAQGSSSEADRRRRASGISTIRTLRPGEKSFGISKVGIVSQLNMHRLVYRDASIGWNVVTAHLLYVQHLSGAAHAIRIQASETLDQILVNAPRNLSTASEELQRRVQTLVLEALASQAQPQPRAPSSTDVEIRRMALDTLYRILELNGHTFIAGWERIFTILKTACPPPRHSAPTSGVATPAPVDASFESQTQLSAPESRGSSKIAALVRTSFPSLQLICSDFLSALTIEELRLCISTLSEFGKQSEDVNVALTAGGLLWNVSDHLQVKRKEGDNEVAHSELWMFMLHQLLSLCKDSRQEVRDGAINILFRSVSMYGTSLSKTTWEAVMWDVLFPLLDSLSATIRNGGETQKALSEGNDQMTSQLDGPPIRLVEKQWDDSKTLALTSLGNILVNYLATRIIKTARFDDTWTSFIGHVKQSFVDDRPQVATAAMRALEQVLSAPIDEEDQPRMRGCHEIVWAACDETGRALDQISHQPSVAGSKTFTQANLEAFVRVVRIVYESGYTTFDLSRIYRLLAMLKAALMFTKSPDYRPDVDALTAVQASVLDVVASVDLNVAGVPSAVLSDLAEYTTLAFVAAFDPVLPDGRKSLTRVTYVALTKAAMPRVLDLFQRHKEDVRVYEDGAVEHVFSAYALPIKLKHDCPPSSRSGTEQPLWKTATVHFLCALRDCVQALDAMGQQISTENYERIWRQIIEAFRGAMLASSDHAPEVPLDERRAEESFDLSFIVALEEDVLPKIGQERVPDELIFKLGRCLQAGSRLYELDLPDQHANGVAASSEVSSLADDLSSVKSLQETRFDRDFDRQATEPLSGTTVDIIESPRERFAYWCLDLLFLVCSDQGQGDSAARARVSALCLPLLLNRCIATIKTYVADAPLKGKMPFPRIRQEELAFILQRLSRLRLRPNTLWASTQSHPSQAVNGESADDDTRDHKALLRTHLLRSPLAHLYRMYPLITSLLSLAISSPSITSAYIPFSRKDSSDDLQFTFVGLKPEESDEGEHEVDIVKLVLRCLSAVGEEIGANA